MRPLFKTMIVVAVAASVVGCGSDEDGENEETPDSVIVDPDTGETLDPDESDEFEILPPHSPGESLDDQYYEESRENQRKTIKEGAITTDTYTQALETVVECSAEQDIKVTIVDAHPMQENIPQIMLMSEDIPDDIEGSDRAIYARPFDDCVHAHSRMLENEMTPIMADDLMEYAQNCLEEENYSPTGNEVNADDLRDSVDNSRNIVEGCLSEGLDELYPGTNLI